MNNNPSPGNKAGGLTTILEKSLGAAAKGGTTTLTRRLRIRRAGHGEGLRLHGHARATTRSRRPARSPAARNVLVLHDRPRLGLRLQAGAVDQARHQLPTSTAAWTTTWTSTAATSSTACTIEAEGRGDLRRRSCASPPASSTKTEELGYGDNEFVPWQIGAVM